MICHVHVYLFRPIAINEISYIVYVSYACKLTLEKDGYGSVGRLVGIAGPLLLPPALPLGLLLLRLGSRRGDGSRGNLLLPGAHGAHPPTLPNEHVGKRAGRWWGDGIDGGAHYVNAVNFRYVDFGCWIGVAVDR